MIVCLFCSVSSSAVTDVETVVSLPWHEQAAQIPTTSVGAALIADTDLAAREDALSLSITKVGSGPSTCLGASE